MSGQITPEVHFFTQSGLKLNRTVNKTESAILNVRSHQVAGGFNTFKNLLNCCNQVYFVVIQII